MKTRTGRTSDNTVSASKMRNSFSQAPCLTFEDTRFDYDEPRFITFGVLAGRLVAIAHTPRDEKTRIISMRKGNRREKKIYQKRLEES